MSLGKKRSSTPKIKIEAPPRITRVDTVTPTGSSFSSINAGSTIRNEITLDPLTRATMNSSLSGLYNLTNSLAGDDNARSAEIADKANAFYNQQATSINEAADLSRQSLASQLSRQFGGRYNATFGNDLLARQERDRLAQLSEARQNASLLAEDLNQADEASRINRFGVLQGYLDTLTNQALGVQSRGSQLLQTDRNQAANQALQRANLLQRYYNDSAANDRINRSNLLGTIGGTTLGLARQFF
ncbi:MAG: hypothetical protein AAGI66_08170 [Cyanobacteria bacterium P01_H01_bin.74]